MTIRLMAEARGAYRKEFLDALLEVAGDEVELSLHFGDKNSDFDAPSLVRQEVKDARSGRLLAKRQYKGANLPLMRSPDFQRNAEMFVDQLHRSSPKYLRRSHKMLNINEYLDYYHILTDAIAQEITEREITHAVFFDVPHLAVDTAIYHVARALGVKTLILSQYFPDLSFSAETIEEIGQIDLGVVHADGAGESLANDLHYMSAEWQGASPRGTMGWREVARFYAHLVTTKPAKLLSPKYQAQILGRMKKLSAALPVWRTPFKRFFDFDWLEYLEGLSGFEDQEVDLGEDYIYFPLHFQPEMTTSSLGAGHTDQLLAIEKLSRLLPDGWKIYVKENPKQGPFSRGAMFFHRLINIPNVRVMPSDADTKILTARSKVVATITGTVALEAVNIGKPAITFGHAYFEALPGIHKYNDELDLSAVSRAKIDIETVKVTEAALRARFHRANLDKGFFQLAEDFGREENARDVGTLLYNLLTNKELTTFCAQNDS